MTPFQPSNHILMGWSASFCKFYHPTPSCSISLSSDGERHRSVSVFRGTYHPRSAPCGGFAVVSCSAIIKGSIKGDSKGGPLTACECNLCDSGSLVVLTSTSRESTACQNQRCTSRFGKLSTRLTTSSRSAFPSPTTSTSSSASRPDFVASRLYSRSRAALAPLAASCCGCASPTGRARTRTRNASTSAERASSP